MGASFASSTETAPVAGGTRSPQLTPCYLGPNRSQAVMFNPRQTSQTVLPLSC